MIELGLARIARLAPKTYTWKAVHVAGTNGKGSICAYLSAMIKEVGFRPARFNSPHLIDRWDSISIDESTVDKDVFDHAEILVKTRDHDAQINGSEFELLTATAFDIFNQSRPQIDYGVIEVGLGGRLDATNVLSNVEVSVIAKIGIDHQAQLGNTIEQIAREKAGIMRPKVPCIIDGTNTPEVLKTLQAHAEEVGTPISFVSADASPQTYAELQPFFNKQNLEPHQKNNILIAIEAMKMLLSRRQPPVKVNIGQLVNAIANTQWPGRLQRISIGPLTGRKQNVLLDGAHNLQSAEVLATHVNRTLRGQGQPITWFFAASSGKDITSILKSCLQPGDRIVPVRFGSVDGMPWVRSMEVDDIGSATRALDAQIEIVDNDDMDMDSLLDRLRLASDIAQEGPLVIAGSLYLVSDVLRLLRDSR